MREIKKIILCLFVICLPFICQSKISQDSIPKFISIYRTSIRNGKIILHDTTNSSDSIVLSKVYEYRGVLNLEGKDSIGFFYKGSFIYPFHPKENGVIEFNGDYGCVKTINGKIKFIRVNGQDLFEGVEFDNVKYPLFNNGYALVSNRQKWWIIDEKNNLIGRKYGKNKLLFPHNNTYWVKSLFRYKLISISGGHVLDRCSFQQIEYIDSGYLLKKKNKKEVYINCK